MAPQRLCGGVSRAATHRLPLASTKSPHVPESRPLSIHFEKGRCCWNPFKTTFKNRLSLLSFLFFYLFLQCLFQTTFNIRDQERPALTSVISKINLKFEENTDNDLKIHTHTKSRDENKKKVKAQITRPLPPLSPPPSPFTIAQAAIKRIGKGQ